MKDKKIGYFKTVAFLLHLLKMKDLGVLQLKLPYF